MLQSGTAVGISCPHDQTHLMTVMVATIRCPLLDKVLELELEFRNSLYLPPPPRRNAHRSFLFSSSMPVLPALKCQPCLTVSVSPSFSIPVVHPLSHMYQVEQRIQVRTQSLSFSSWDLFLGCQCRFSARGGLSAAPPARATNPSIRHPRQNGSFSTVVLSKTKSTGLPPVLSN